MALFVFFCFINQDLVWFNPLTPLNTNFTVFLQCIDNLGFTIFVCFVRVRLTLVFSSLQTFMCVSVSAVCQFFLLFLFTFGKIPKWVEKFQGLNLSLSFFCLRSSVTTEQLPVVCLLAPTWFYLIWFLFYNVYCLISLIRR